MLYFKFCHWCDYYKCNLEYSNEQNVYKILQVYEGQLMKIIFFIFVFAFVVFLAVLMGEGRK